jgi:hypothetical protein
VRFPGSEELKETFETLARIDQLWAEGQKANAIVRDEGAAEGSRAAVDAKDQFGRFVLQHAGTLWDVAADHVAAWRNVKVQPMAAHATLARGGMEAAVTCRWLVDPKVDAAERRWRGAVLELEDRRQRRTWEAAGGFDKVPRAGDARTAAERYDEQAVGMKRGGLWRGQPGKSGRSANEPKMPEATELFRVYAEPLRPGKGEWLYRTLSGFAHHRAWALTFFGKHTDVKALPGAYRVNTGAYTSNDLATQVFAAAAIELIEVALAELRDYQGR